MRAKVWDLKLMIMRELQVVVLLSTDTLLVGPERGTVGVSTGQ